MIHSVASAGGRFVAFVRECGLRRGGEGARLFVVAAAVVAGRRGGILFANVKRSQSVQKGRWHSGGQKSRAGQTRGRLEKTGLSAGTNSR